MSILKPVPQQPLAVAECTQSVVVWREARIKSETDGIADAKVLLAKAAMAEIKSVFFMMKEVSMSDRYPEGTIRLLERMI